MSDDNENENENEMYLTSDDESLALLDDNLTKEEQEKLILFFQSVQDDLTGMSNSGEVEINWETREILAFPEGATEPTKTWSLDEVLGKTKESETVH